MTGGWARATARAGEDSRLRGSGYNYGAFAEFGGWEGLFALGPWSSATPTSCATPTACSASKTGSAAAALGFDGAVGFRTPMMGATADILAGVSPREEQDPRIRRSGFINFRGKSTEHPRAPGRPAAVERLDRALCRCDPVPRIQRQHLGPRDQRLARGSMIDIRRAAAPGARLEAGIGGSERLAPILAL